MKNCLLAFPVLSICIFHTDLLRAQTVERIEWNSADPDYGHYLQVKPEGDSIAGVLVLLGGFGERPEQVFPETKLEETAQKHHMLTIAYAGGNKLYADTVVVQKLNAVLKDVQNRHRVAPENFVLGGFSAGGAIALRYVELCYEFPDKFPVRPKGVFMVDSPIDIFTVWESLEENLHNNYSAPAVAEARFALPLIKSEYGVPHKNVKVYAKLTAFSMNKAYAQPEKFLRNVAVRAYHDVDIAWRLTNRNQTVHNSNYEMTAELINRLLLMGNTRAEFIQTFGTGYRSDGQRHPHSWSIVDAEECIVWAEKLFAE